MYTVYSRGNSSKIKIFLMAKRKSSNKRTTLKRKGVVKRKSTSKGGRKKPSFKKQPNFDFTIANPKNINDDKSRDFALISVNGQKINERGIYHLKPSQSPKAAASKAFTKWIRFQKKLEKDVRDAVIGIREVTNGSSRVFYYKGERIKLDKPSVVEEFGKESRTYHYKSKLTRIR